MTDLANLAAAVISEARQMSGLTAPEFDYHIKVHGMGGKHGELGNATFTVATQHLPESTTPDARIAAADQLWTDLQPELQAYEARCRNRDFSGWSNAAKSTGQRIRYAS